MGSKAWNIPFHADREGRQGSQLSGCLTLLPILMLNSEQRDEPLGLRDYLGWGIWSFGFVTEAITDQQKWLFKGNPDNAGKFIQRGLWGDSRHPNYLGEILQWSGLCFVCDEGSPVCHLRLSGSCCVSSVGFRLCLPELCQEHPGQFPISDVTHFLIGCSGTRGNFLNRTTVIIKHPVCWFSPTVSHSRF